MRDQQHRSSITLYSRCYYFNTLYIQIVGRLVQDKEVGRVVTNHQAAESDVAFFRLHCSWMQG